MKECNKLNQFIDGLFETKWGIYFILILTALIVLPNITRESLWIDEIFSATASFKTSSLYSMFSQYIFKDIHPPLYQTLLYYWSRTIGGSDFELRLLSYTFILISFIFSYLLLTKYFTRRVATLFIAASALTPGILYYAQEVRSYALLYGLSNILAVLFVIFMVSIKDNSRIKSSLFVLYFISGTLVCYTHLFGYLVVFSLSSIAILYSIYLRRKSITKSLVATSFFIAVLGITWLLITFGYGEISNKTQGNFWIENSFKKDLLKFSYLIFYNKIGLIIAGIITFIAFLLSFSKLVGATKKYLFILFPALLLLATAFLISLNTPIITPRNLIVLIPLILLFIAFIFNESYVEGKVFIAVCLLLLLIATTLKNFTYEKKNWRDASIYIERNFDNLKCKVPTRDKVDQSIGAAYSMYPSYYLGEKFTYSIQGPEVQNRCGLIYFSGHSSKEAVEKILTEKNITIPYEILNFNKVYVVIKKANT